VPSTSVGLQGTAAGRQHATDPVKAPLLNKIISVLF